MNTNVFHIWIYPVKLYVDAKFWAFLHLYPHKFFYKNSCFPRKNNKYFQKIYTLSLFCVYNNWFNIFIIWREVVDKNVMCCRKLNVSLRDFRVKFCNKTEIYFLKYLLVPLINTLFYWKCVSVSFLQYNYILKDPWILHPNWMIWSQMHLSEFLNWIVLLFNVSGLFFSFSFLFPSPFITPISSSTSTHPASPRVTTLVLSMSSFSFFSFLLNPSIPTPSHQSCQPAL